MKTILIESLFNPNIVFLIRGNGEECSVDIERGKMKTYAILSKVEKKLIESKIKQRNELKAETN